MAATKNAPDIFLNALDRAPADRAAYLDEACGDDAVLRLRVEALLRANDDPGAFLSEANPGVEDAAPLPSPSKLNATVDPGPGVPKHGATGEYTPEPEDSPPHPVATGDYRPQFEPGLVIAGRYKLLEQIGEGGMGAVWVAEQTQPVRRKVALKLIKAGMDSKSVLARFEAERQALAVMDHPNIAKVLDGGLTETGRPYFVMEYVKGVPITGYCDATRMSVSERLNLFVQVCSAVQHAHQKGIIHRDLKPSNILVAPYDDKPVPKVIDFGLAKAMHQSLTERTLHTAHEAVLGTPRYMSPEQAQLNNLDVDTRSDIYSLGVLLYELLTGTTPLEKKRVKEAAWDEMKRLIREEEAPRPSTRLSSSNTLASLAATRQTEPAKLPKLVRGELDWIVMKSLEKDRTRRYETANGFAMDIQRHLAGEPVLAAPPSSRYRLRKFARKHRAALTTAAALGLLLVAGVAVSSWQAVRATRAEAAALAALDEKDQARQAEANERQRAEQSAKQAQRQRDEAVRERNRADESFRLAREAVDRYLAKVGSSPRLERAGLQTLRKELLDDAGAFYEQLIRLKAHDPTMKAELAEALQGFAGVARWNGATQKAIERMERALKLFEELATADPENESIQSKLVTVAVDLAGLLVDHGSIQRAEELYRRALNVQGRLTAARPQDEARQAGLAYVYYGYALLCHRARRREQATELGEKAQGVYARLAALHPSDNAVGAFKNKEAGSLINLGLMDTAARRFDRAEQALERALKLFRELSQANPDSTWLRSGVGRSLVNLGTLYMSTGRPEHAETAFNEVLAIYQALAHEDPEMTRWQESLAMSWEHLALVYRTRNQINRVVEANENICNVWEKLCKRYSEEVSYRLQLARARSFRAASWARMGNHTKAADEAKEMLKQPVLPNGLVYNWACVFALAASAAQSDDKLPKLERAQLAASYAGKAVETLQRSIQAGWKDAQHMKMDDDLKALRDRDDFKKLVRELEKSQAVKSIGPVHEVGQGLELRGQLDKQTPSLFYQVKLAAGKTYVIDMVGPDQKALDPYLVLTDATGQKLAEDKKSGDGLNARIVFRAEQAGTYRLQATAFNGGAGAFTLTVGEQANPPKEEKK
jgi:eukaryotic-like serine/threonine-protein kinase